jgi:hypothetical protein
MHPVSNRGRSMPRDRQTFRAFFLVMGIVCWSLSTGCLRSTVSRQDDGPAARPALTLAPPLANPTNSPNGAGTTSPLFLRVMPRRQDQPPRLQRN